jgi:MFS transporter, DHA2 family, multidrug resistance protein
MSHFNLSADFAAVILPRVLQGVGMAFFFVPLTTLTVATIPMNQMGNATGIFNLLRNIGASFGVAVTSTLLSHRAQVHQARLVELLDFNDPRVQSTVANFSHFLAGRGVPSAVSQPAALGGLTGQVIRQAMMLAFNDAFFIMFLFTLAVVPLVLLFKNEKAAPPMGAH